MAEILSLRVKAEPMMIVIEIDDEGYGVSWDGVELGPEVADLLRQISFDLDGTVCEEYAHEAPSRLM